MADSEVALARLSDGDKAAIRLAFLTEAGASVKVLAERYDRSPQSIRNVLKGPDYELMKAQVQSEMGEEALAILRRNAPHAAQRWIEALEVSAEKGDHKAAKDLLQATKIIESESTGPAVTVNFGLKIVGVPVE